MLEVLICVICATSSHADCISSKSRWFEYYTDSFSIIHFEIIEDLDHVYFVHPLTDISVDISTDARPTIGRYLGRYSGQHSADTLTVDYWQNIGRLSVVYRSTVL